MSQPIAAILGPLEMLRRRLLDLTRRNSLINFRHPKSSLRVVDELPDQLFTELTAGKVFVITPVPNPPKFKDAGEDIKHLYPERAGQRVKPDVVEWAKRSGINTSYELPMAASTEDSRHRDKKMQTLLYPEDLESQLAKIVAIGRTAIEESGVNIMYLAFGFLSWRDQEHAKPNLAPLMLLPVTVTKTGLDPVTRRYKYEIAYSGEDIEPNISLIEKLKEFNIDLPGIEEDELPEAYLQRCCPILAGQPDWKFHRFVTLGFFQFGKLLMYLDLNPTNWPEGFRLDQHHIISRILAGETGSATEFAQTHPIDDLLPDTPSFQLVTEADSTQHSAIIDSYEGKDLVIEGPPGTGKSQTITNIIAVALNDNKSVLFVAEKLAALKVVKDRLDKLGLGDFCLELHSNRANKKRFYDDLRTRCELNPATYNPVTLTNRLADLQKARLKLNEYSALVNEVAPDLDITYHELFCRAVRLEELLPAIELKPDILKQQNELDQDWLATLESRVARANVSRTDIINRYGSLDAHPWSYLVPKGKVEGNTDPVDEIQTWLEALKAVRTAAAPLVTAGIAPGGMALGLLTEISNVQSRLPTPTDMPASPLARLLTVEDEAKRLRDLAQREQMFDMAYTKLANLYEQQRLTDAGWLKGVADACGKLHKLPFDVPIKTFSAALSVREAIADYLASQQDVANTIGQIEQQLGMRPAAGIDVIKVSASILRCAATAPRGSLHWRYAGLEQVTDIPAVEALAADITNLIREKDRAELAFHFDLSKGDGAIGAAAEILQRGGLFSFLDGEWRSANQIYKRLCKAPSWFKPSRTKGAELAKLVALRERVTELESSPRNAALLGVGFKGLATKADDFVKLLKWHAEIKTAMGQHGAHTVATLALVNLPEERIGELHRCSMSGGSPILEHAAATIATLRKIVSEAELQAVVGDPIKAAPAETWLLNFQVSLDTIATGLLQQGEKIAVIEETVRQQLAQLSDEERLAGRQQFGLEKQGTGPLDSQGQATLKLMLQWTAVLWGSRAAEMLRAAYLKSLSSKTLPADYEAMVGFCKSAVAQAVAGDKIANSFQVNFGPVAGEPKPKDASLDVVVARLQGSLAKKGDWESWVAYTNAIHALGELDGHLKAAARGFHRGELSAEQLQAVCEFLFYNTHATIAMMTHREFNNFESNVHESVRARFKKLDEEVCQLHRKMIVADLLEKYIPEGHGGHIVGHMTEMALLTHNMSKQRPRTSMRQVMARAGNAVQALKPCFMMGPLSVAQFLKPGEIQFDLVVMDEASQMRPEDALGAIARGGQLIVVGDPNQLPPTAFFDHIDDDDVPAEAEYAVADKESILDVVTPLFQPVRRLGWHYRSQHESLIAFSNKQFYGNSLMLFPSSRAKSDDLGIHYSYVEDGMCLDSVNVREAAEVVHSTLKEIRRTNGKLSVGIVAMNIKQMGAISEEWDRQLKGLPEMMAMVEKLGGGPEGEPFFIKNLETVQGDERDIIVISMTYGPHSETSRTFHQHYGPINNPGGWRRLNVLFTRARRKMIILSSMYANGVTAENKGALALKGFLQYCETGRLPEQPVLTDRGPANEFEEQVAAIVEQEGFKAVPQVGVAGYFIDIGVMHDAAPGQYLLGIECDGAPYHSAKSARDRDRLREKILRDMGWHLHRIWSPDWFSRANPEKQRLVATLQRLRETLPPAEPVLTAPIVVDQAALKKDSKELRERLRAMRVTIEGDFPDVPAGRQLLRDEILELLVTRKPTTYSDFTDVVPHAMRIHIDSGEARDYLGAVFSIIDEYV